MAAPLASRVPKTNRNLLKIAMWAIAIFSVAVLAQRFLSGDTMQRQREDADAAKQLQSVAQSTQSAPAAIAALFESQRNDSGQAPPPNGTAAPWPTPAATPGGSTSASMPARAAAPNTPSAASSSTRSVAAAAPQYQGSAKSGEGVPLRMPDGRPDGPANYADTPNLGSGTSPDRVRSQARASDLAVYEDTGDVRPTPPSPANMLLEQLKALQPGASGANNPQAMAEYLRTLQGVGAGQQRAPTPQSPQSRNGGLEWLSAQQVQGHQDDEPLRPTSVTSEYLLQEGTPIRIALIQDIKSDLPGEFSAMVTRDVYDSQGRGHKLIPWGTKLRGRYNSEVSPGQNRLLFAFQTMRWASGARLALRGMPGSDLGGAVGAEGEVNRHFWQTFGSALAVGTAAMVAGRATNGGSNVTINLGGTSNSGSSVATQALSDVVKQMLSRNENIKDTLSLKKGDELTIVTNRDLELPPSITGASQSN